MRDRFWRTYSVWNLGRSQRIYSLRPNTRHQGPKRAEFDRHRPEKPAPPPAPQYNAWLHRFAILLAACTLLLVVAGGLVTSNDAGLSVPDWPLSYGQLMPPMEGGIFYEHGHRMIATLVGLLTIVMAVLLWCADPRRWMKTLGGIAVLAVVAQGVLGGLTVIYLLPPAVSVAHACLAQLFFSLTVAMALFTSRSWFREPQPADDRNASSVWFLSIAAPVSILVQVALGAAARHKALGAIYHIGAASIVTAVILWISVRVMQRYSGHAALNGSALALLAISFVQVFLGIAAYMSRIATADAVQPMPVMIVFTVLHVATGALTMAASVILTIQIYRNVQHAGNAFAREPVAAAS